MRTARKDFTVGGYSIRAGDPLILGYTSVIENDARWAGEPADSPLAPARFAPERFLAGDARRRPGTWMPFGSGLRTWPGYPLALLEIKVGDSWWVLVVVRGLGGRVPYWWGGRMTGRCLQAGAYTGCVVPCGHGKA
jgi:hypothetical protein